MTTKSGVQSRQQRNALFAQSGQIATNAAKGLGTSDAAEAAGDLLLHFDHPKISLGQIVVKIHAKTFQEAEKGFLVFAQSIEQIAGGTLFGSSLFPRWGNSSWMSLVPFIKDSHKLRFPIGDLKRTQPVFSLRSCLRSRVLHVQKQGFEIGSPYSALLLSQKGQLAQEMHIATGMLTGIHPVRSPSIMHRDPFEVWQDPDCIQCRLTATGIDLIMGERRRTGDMLPVPLARNVQAGFILMDDVCLFQRLFDLLLHLLPTVQHIA